MPYAGVVNPIISPSAMGPHAKIHFDGTEAGDREPFDKGAVVISGPALTLADTSIFASMPDSACEPAESGTLLSNQTTRKLETLP